MCDSSMKDYTSSVTDRRGSYWETDLHIAGFGLFVGLADYDKYHIATKETANAWLGINKQKL